MSVLGFDIGGANIKAAMADGRTRSVPFPLWKHPEQLAGQLATLVTEFADCEQVAVTMTGELADCYTTRSEGVRDIGAAVSDAVGRRPVRFWTTAGWFKTAAELNADPLPAAAANWHALATWIGMQLPQESALLIDIGTTTTDIIPIQFGQPAAIGLTDRERLATGELVYTGVRRTPLCAVIQRAPWGDHSIPLAAELFATTLDIYLLLDELAEDPRDTDTANGRPATKATAHDRIARMLCSDRDDVSLEQAVELAKAFAVEQERQIAAAVRTVIHRQNPPPTVVVLSGSGEFLARKVVAARPELQGCRMVSLTATLAPEIAAAACAYALTQLALRHS